MGVVALVVFVALGSGSDSGDATTDVRDAPPSGPELSLKITNPDPSKTTTVRSDTIELEGAVDPPFASVEVSVLGDEHDVHVSKSGRFSQEVKLGGKLGNRSINVTATLGSSQETETVLVDKELTAAELEAKREAARQKRLEAKQERQEARAAAQAEREQELEDAILSFSGNGALNLGTIQVTEPSTLYWTNDGGLFSLSDAAYRIFVNSQGASGKTAAPAGSYRRVDVNAIGNWTVTIRPNALGPP